MENGLCLSLIYLLKMVIDSIAHCNSLPEGRGCLPHIFMFFHKFELFCVLLVLNGPYYPWRNYHGRTAMKRINGGCKPIKQRSDSWEALARTAISLAKTGFQIPCVFFGPRYPYISGFLDSMRNFLSKVVINLDFSGFSHEIQT